MPHSTKQLLGKFLLWALLWVIVIGGVGALFNLSDIKDDNRRADLARRGSRTTGIVFSRDRFGLGKARRCGRGAFAVVQFTPAGKTPQRICIDEGLPPEYQRYARLRPMPELTAEIVYDPGNPSNFYVAAPDGTIPRRNLDGLWRRWGKRTAILAALYCVGTAIFLFRKSRKSAG